MPDRTPATWDRRIIWVNRFFYPDESATSIMLTDLVGALTPDDRARHYLITSNASYATGDEDGAAALAQVTVHRIAAIGRSNTSLLVRGVNFVLFYAGALLWLARLARRDDVIVSLTDPPLIGVVCGFVARLKHARLVHWVQDIFPETASRLGFAREGGLLDHGLQRIRDASWRHAAASVVIGRNMNGYLASHGVAPDRITVIQNWADDLAITPVERASNRLRQDWGFGLEDCVVGYSGNLGRAHDIDTKIAAMLQLHEQAEQAIRYLFIGGGARQADLRFAARQLPDDRVTFRPYQPMAMLAQSLSVPDIHWLSLNPRLEGLIVPSKLYGALAVGRPVVFVGGADAEVARIVAEADCGASFIPGQTAELVAYLAQLANNAAERKRLGANARTYLDQHLRRDARVMQWRALLEGLIR